MLDVAKNEMEDVRVLQQVPWVMKGGAVVKSP